MRREGGTPKADKGTDKLRECDSDKWEGVKTTSDYADVMCERPSSSCNWMEWMVTQSQHCPLQDNIRSLAQSVEASAKPVCSVTNAKDGGVIKHGEFLRFG